jgi:hypothetical protein
MKTLKAISFSLLLLIALPVIAQPPLNQPDYNKPQLFADLPSRLPVQLARLETLLSLSEGAPVNQQLATGLTWRGIVSSVSSPQDASVKSVVIRSTDRQGAVLTFSRLTRADGSRRYRVLIMSRQHIDGLELVNEDGQYYLQKKNLYDLISE